MKEQRLWPKFLPVEPVTVLKDVGMVVVMLGNTSMETLCLNGNNVGNEGAILLAEMLKTNTTLKTLELNSNSIEYEGAAALAEALAQNSTLKNLAIRYLAA